MKKISALLLMAIAMFAATSCSFDDTSYEVPKPTIDPPFEFHFVFDEENVPHRVGMPAELWEETQKDFLEQVVGYGWEWVQTHEIKPDGCPKIEDYYQGLYGIGPSHFYIKSEWEAVEYFHSDSKNEDAFRHQPIYIDAVHGRILFNPLLIEPPFTRRFDTFGLYEFQGTWHIAGVEYLGQRCNDGKYTDVWGWSEYKRMSAKRLKEIQKQYALDVTPVEPTETATKKIK